MADGEAGMTQPIRIIRAANILGEGVLWDIQTQCLWWTDIHASQLLRYEWHGGVLRRYALPERLCSFGFVENSTQLIAAFASGIALYEPATQRLQWLARPEADRAGIRFNDGRVDRQGRFWAGGMVEDKQLASSANLYCIDGHGQAHLRESGIGIANGLCFSVDGRHCYFADSARGSIHVYGLQEPQGNLQQRRLFATAASGAEPDGANIDAQGYMWSAQWGAGQVIRYAPDGHIERTLAVPASQPTCIAFGGPELNLLFVTSARAGLDEATLAQQPHAGDVFVYDLGISGLPEAKYRYHPALSSHTD